MGTGGGFQLGRHTGFVTCFIATQSFTDKRLPSRHRFCFLLEIRSNFLIIHYAICCKSSLLFKRTIWVRNGSILLFQGPKPLPFRNSSFSLLGFSWRSYCLASWHRFWNLRINFWLGGLSGLRQSRFSLVTIFCLNLGLFLGCEWVDGRFFHRDSWSLWAIIYFGCLIYA